jgi:hypothetical protein
MLRPGLPLPGPFARPPRPDDAPPDIQHVVLRGLWAYWAGKLRDGVLPARRHISPAELRPWLGNLLLLDVIGGGRDFRYRLHGARLVQMFGDDLTGRCVSALPLQNVEALLAEGRQAVATRNAVYIEDGIVAEKTFIRISKLILPLAVDGVAVDMLLVGIYAQD